MGQYSVAGVPTSSFLTAVVDCGCVSFQMSSQGANISRAGSTVAVPFVFLLNWYKQCVFVYNVVPVWKLITKRSLKFTVWYTEAIGPP